MCGYVHVCVRRMCVYACERARRREEESVYECNKEGDCGYASVKSEWPRLAPSGPGWLRAAPAGSAGLRLP
jgi:hypothetical protein